MELCLLLGTESKQAERTSSEDCSATDIFCPVTLSSEELPRSVLFWPLKESLFSKPISSFSPDSNNDSTRVALSMCTARLTSFSITSHTESDTGESSSMRSKFCKILNRFTPCGLLLTCKIIINEEHDFKRKQLDRFHLKGFIVSFPPQTQKLEPPCTA